MTSSHKSTITKPELYAQHVKDWQLSGLSQKQYCKSANITYSTFVYWRTKLLHKDKSRPQKFVPLSLSSPPALEGSSVLEQKISVMTPEGMRLIFPLAIAPTLFGQYLKAMRVDS